MSKRLSLFAAAAATCAVLAGCGNDFEPGSHVTSLRVLAVEADQTYAHPGEDVHLKALWLDPTNAPKHQWGWAVCVDPEASSVLGCLGKLVQDAQAAGRAPSVVIADDQDTFTATVPTDAISRLPADAQVNAELGVVTVLCPGTLTIVQNGDATGTLPFRCTDATGRVLGPDEFVAGIKRIWVRQKDRNANPTIARVTWDGQDWPEGEVKHVSGCNTDGYKYDDCKDADHHDVALDVSQESFESGVDETGAAFHEQLVVQYYATDGLFQHDVRVASDPTSAWVARKSASGKTVTMILVARDDRGGVVWTTRSIAVQ